MPTHDFAARDELERRYDGPIPPVRTLASAIRQAEGQRRMYGAMMRDAALSVRTRRGWTVDPRYAHLSLREVDQHIRGALANWDYYRRCRRNMHREVLRLRALRAAPQAAKGA